MKTTDPKELWKIALAQIEIKIDSVPQFKSFFKDTKLIRIDGKNAHIGVLNPYASDWLKSRYEKLIKDTLTYIYGDTLNPVFEVIQAEDSSGEIAKEESPLLMTENGLMGSVVEAINKSGLNPKYVISNYIIGNSNRIAHAAALGVIDRPGEAYNPLFIYGKTGVGKTHLAQGIGRAIIERDPRKKILYVTSEGFMNDLITGIRNNFTEKNRQKYRKLDVLIIDDMQLISKWVHTQEEFFNTFNELHNSGKQIILIADRRPEEIEKIQDRLRTRMQGGMVAEIMQPDFETRLAILQKRADSAGYNLKPAILEFIARTVSESVRELEGALQKVALFNQMKPDGDLTLEEVAHTIGKDSRTKREQIKVPKVLREVSKTFGVTVKDLKGPRRTKDLALARQVAMYILRDEFNYKLEEIAKYLNRQDHTTVIHAIDKIKSKMLVQEAFNKQLSSLITSINDSAVINDDF